MKLTKPIKKDTREKQLELFSALDLMSEVAPDVVKASAKVNSPGFTNQPTKHLLPWGEEMLGY